MNGQSKVMTACAKIVVENKRGPQGGITAEAQAILIDLNAVLDKLRTFSAAAFDVPSGEWPAAIYDPEHNVIEFGIPRGATGLPGVAATVQIGTVITGGAGTNALVANSGTESAAILNFTLPRGTPGIPGAAATVEIGTITTGDAGTNAAVSNSGTDSAAMLNFTLPRGREGRRGKTGQPGPPGQAPVIDAIDCGGACQTQVTAINGGTAGDFA
jgi:hypothetical protein